jgi:murein DD-endopeptidase MepM/ murein hydrolase activator NlpD
VKRRPETPKESERYRGRRRYPTPSKGRYAAALAAAAVGAGTVALGAGPVIPNAKTETLAGDVAAHAPAPELLARADIADRANRGTERTTADTSDTVVAWMLPVHGYELGARHGDPARGIDLTGLPEGTPVAAMRAGTVVQAGWNGAFGYSVIVDHGYGVRTVYAHASRVLVPVGRRVAAGDEIALLGNTGLSRGPQLHLELYVGGVPHDPLTWFADRGVDFDLEIEAPYGL